LTSKIARGAGLLSAGALVGVLTLGLSATQASAQVLPPYYPGVAVYPGYMPGLPPHEVVAIVRSTGLEPLSGPMRHGVTYSVRAVDPAGREYRVFVDARIGRVLRAVPLPGPYYAGPIVPPYGHPMGPSAMAPDGYGPSSRIAALPPGAGGPPINGPAVAGGPGGSAPGANTTPHPKVQAGPPLPRPRPKLAATDSSAPTGAPPQAAQAPAAPSPGTIKETNDTTGAVPPTAPAPAAAPPAPAAAPPAPPPMPDELHE
jgi:hypothetical protein